MRSFGWKKIEKYENDEFCIKLTLFHKNMTKNFTSALRLLIRIRWTRKKHYFYYLTAFYPLLRVFKYNRKFSFLKYRFFCLKKIFFQKSEYYKFKRILWATQIKKPKKKILSRSGVISILVKCLKSRKNQNISRNIEFLGLILC